MSAYLSHSCRIVYLTLSPSQKFGSCSRAPVHLFSGIRSLSKKLLHPQAECPVRIFWYRAPYLSRTTRPATTTNTTIATNKSAAIDGPYPWKCARRYECMTNINTPSIRTLFASSMLLGWRLANEPLCGLEPRWIGNYGEFSPDQSDIAVIASCMIAGNHAVTPCALKTFIERLFYLVS